MPAPRISCQLAGEHLGRDEIGLGEEDAGRRPAVPDHDQVALESLQIEVVVTGLHDEDDIDVRRDHLELDGLSGRLATQAGPALEDGVHDAERIARRLLDTDPVADARPLQGSDRLVQELPRQLPPEGAAPRRGAATDRDPPRRPAPRLPGSSQRARARASNHSSQPKASRCELFMCRLSNYRNVSRCALAPRRASSSATPDEALIGVVIANPEPDQILAIANGQCPIARIHSR